MNGKMKPGETAHGGTETPHSESPLEDHAENARSGKSAATAPGEGTTGDVGADADTRLGKENAELKDRLLRALAEAENIRRRASRDLDDMRQYAITQFARDMLPVADNLERAVASIPSHGREGEQAVETLIEGVELTGKELLRSLEKHGVRKLEPLGERFDPNFHEAMFEVPDAAVPSGTVIRVVQPGYAIGSRTLRPAKVGISSGGPQNQPSPAPSDGPGSPPGKRDT